MVVAPDGAVRRPRHDALEGSPDVILDAVGMSGAIAEAIDFVKHLGTVVSLGFSSGTDTFAPQVALTNEALPAKFEQLRRPSPVARLQGDGRPPGAREPANTVSQGM